MDADGLHSSPRPCYNSRQRGNGAAGAWHWRCCRIFAYFSSLAVSTGFGSMMPVEAAFLQHHHCNGAIQRFHRSVVARTDVPERRHSDECGPKHHPLRRQSGGHQSQ